MSPDNRPPADDKMIFTVITVERGKGTQLPDGSIDWSGKPTVKKGLMVQAEDMWSIKLINEMKFMMSNVIGEVYKVWNAVKHGN